MDITKDLLRKMELFNVKTSEISIVDKGANKKKFYLIKNKEGIIMEELIKVLAKFGVTDVSDETLKKMQEENKSNFEILKNLMDNFKDYTDAMTSDAKSSIQKAVTALIAVKKEDEKPADNSNTEDTDTTKIIAKLTGTIGKMVDEIEKIKASLEMENTEENKEEGNKPETDMKKAIELLEGFNNRLAAIEKISGGKSSLEEGNDKNKEIEKGGADDFPDAEKQFAGE